MKAYNKQLRGNSDATATQPTVLPPGLHGAVKLYLPLGENAGGFLVLEVSDRGDRLREVTVRLDRAHVQLLLVLDGVMAGDAHLPWSARGWRHPKALGQLIGKRTGYVPEAETIRSYLSRMQGRMRAAVQAVGEPITVPELFQRRRNIGARLAVPRLEIIDGAAADGAETILSG